MAQRKIKEIVKPRRKRRSKRLRRPLNVPAKFLIPLFMGAIGLAVVMALTAPGFYKLLAGPTFVDAIFLDGYKDRIYDYGTHEKLKTIELGALTKTISASQAGRELDEIVGIYRNGERDVALVSILTGILGGVVLSGFLIYVYSRQKMSRVTNVIAIGIVAAVIFLNGANALYRSTVDRQAYAASEPFIRGNVALLGFVAIQQNAQELLTQLVTMKFPVDAVDAQKNTLMHHVAELNRIDMFPVLMSVPGIKLDSRNVEGVTPVQIATDKKYTDLVGIFLSHDVDAQNNDERGQTLLHRAAKNSDIRTMKLLLTYVDSLNTPDMNGATPLSLAAKDVDVDMILLLLEYGPEVNAKVDEGLSFFELIISEILIEVQNAPDYTMGNADQIYDTISQSITESTELNGQDDEGKTPLHWVTRLHDTITSFDVNHPFLTRLTLLLLENGADISIVNNAGERALTLEHVIRHNYDDWLLPVIKTDPAYLNKAIINGRSLFQFAVELGNADTLAILFEHGLEPKDWVPNPEVPLRHAVQRNDIETARLLLERGIAEPTTTTSNTNGPIHLAARLNQDQMIELLLEYGFKVNAQGVQGNTPLHYAVETDSMFSIITLLEHGADPLIWNSEGIRPIDLSRTQGIPAIIELIKNAADKANPTVEPQQ